MKIALYTSNRTTTPPERNVVAASTYLTGLLADALVERGHEVTLYAAQGSQTKAHLIDLGLPPTRLDYALQKNEWVKNMNLVLKQLYVSEIIKRSRDYDIIHFQTEPIYLAMPFVKLINTPVVFTNHNIFKVEEKLIWDQFKDVPLIAISNYQRTVFPDLNYKATIYDGIQVESYPYVAKPNTNYLYFLGRITPQKGVEQAIQATKELDRELLISGVGESSYIKTAIDPHLSDKIKNLGLIEKESQEWFEKLGNAYATLCPIQWDEPFGLVLVESMACGTPVIAFSRGSIPELIEDGKTGLIVNPSEEDKRGSYIIKKTGVEGIKEAIQYLYALSEGEYLKMRQQAREHVQKNFTLKRMVDSYEALYKGMI